MRSKVVYVSIFLAVFLLGGTAGWFTKSACAAAEARSLSVARELEKAAFSANSLRLLNEKPATAVKLQELQLRSSVSQLYELTAVPVRFDFAIPNLLEGLNHAEEYARSHGMLDTAQQARRVMERLQSWRAV